MVCVCLLSCDNSDDKVRQHLHSLEKKGLACLVKSQIWITKADSLKTKCEYFKKLDNLEEFNKNAMLCSNAMDSAKYYQSMSYNYKYHYDADSILYLINHDLQWNDDAVNYLKFDTK